MVLYFSSHDLEVYRHRRKGLFDRYGMSVTLTVVDADIQPTDPDKIPMGSGSYGTVYDAYVDQDIDIKEGDQVVDTSNNKRYSVKGVTDWKGAGLLDYRELTLVSMDGGDN